MKKGINSLQLKCICIGLMLAGVCLQQVFYNIGYLIYLSAFPLAAFLLTEAARKTSDRKRLLLRLLTVALLLEIPWDIVIFGLSEWKNWGLSQNYLFTLCVALGVLMTVDATGKKVAPGTMGNTLTTLGIYLVGAFATVLLRTEQSCIGVLMVVALYLFRENKILSLLSVAALYLLFVKRLTGLEFVPAFSILLTWLYDGGQET